MSETGYGDDSNLFRKERENHVLSEPKVSLLTESETNKFEFQKWRLRRIAETFIAAGSGLGSVFVSACPWNSDELVILLSFPRKPCEEFLFHSFRPWPGQKQADIVLARLFVFFFFFLAGEPLRPPVSLFYSAR